jgi:hypothetical protein
MTRVILPIFLAVSTIAAVVAQQGALNQQTATQSGDQFLDGIGETGLIARYVFNGNAEDSSRNQLHATVRGTGAFVADGPRQVLLLTGDGSYVQLPATALAGEDAIAVSLTLARARPQGCSASWMRRDSTRQRLSMARSAAKRRPKRWSRISGCTLPWCSIPRAMC